MVNRNLLRQFEPPDEELRREMGEAFDGGGDDWLPSEVQSFLDDHTVAGRVRRITDGTVWVDVGYKSEGAIELREWYDDTQDAVVPPSLGDEIDVVIEAIEDEAGGIILSYRKAQRRKQWESVISRFNEGDSITGQVTRKIKGGLLVNIGIGAFLPASQVDIRRPPDIGLYIGQSVECKILKIDQFRHNIVLSRRQLLEDRREEMKKKLLAEIQPGQIRKGVVKNIAAFGAFVDLGGMDGLLHVSDMSWGRVTDPRSVVNPDQELEVMILKVDVATGKVALGLKQTTISPWASAADKYLVGSRHKGVVANVMNYGAFVKLEPGVEGLVHISEMSWTRRINHPSELVQVDDEIEVQVLAVNREKEEISLGMKQVLPNPWDAVAERYPPGAVISGVVRNLTNYGAFIEIEQGLDGLLHVSDISWVRKVAHASEVLSKGDNVTCVVLNVDQERKRIALGLKQMNNDPWEGDIPGRYKPGEIKKGKVTKLTNFGVFVELEPGLEGLLHISELADHKVESPEDVVKFGDEIEVKVLRIDAADRKIGLSHRLGVETDVPEKDTAARDQKAEDRPRELRGGTGAGAGALFSLPPPAEGGRTGDGTPETA
jgi:small subunit ribosomal protein S1